MQVLSCCIQVYAASRSICKSKESVLCFMNFLLHTTLLSAFNLLVKTTLLSEFAGFLAYSVRTQSKGIRLTVLC